MVPTLEFVAPGARKIETNARGGEGGKREKWLCDSAEAAAEMLGAGLAGGKSAGKLQLQRLDKQSKTKGSDGAGNELGV